MSSDTFTSVTNQSWFSRLKNSLFGVLIGMLLFFGSFICLWWNEGRAVRTAHALTELKGTVVSIEADQIEPQYEGQPVHLSGQATTNMTLTDDAFGVSATAIKLRRRVEMYQWQEEKKEEKREKVGGGQETTTTYTYSKRWSEQRFNSAGFAQPEGHENPRESRYGGETKIADPVTVGVFSLSSGLLSQMTNYESLSLAADWKLPEPEQKSGIQQGDTVYLAQAMDGRMPNPNQPEVGDLRISWQQVRPTVVSIIARQSKATFSPWQASSAKGLGTEIERLENGQYSAEEMVGHLEAENTMLTWILRIVGYFVMSFGIMMVLQPLAVFASFIPFLGKISRGGIAIFAFFVSAALSLVTIAIAWLAYRPLLAGGLFAGAAIVIGLLLWIVRRRSAPTPA